jgi:hypothetical protein
VKLPCPLSALPAIAEELRKFGVTVEFASETCGFVFIDAGTIHFDHEYGELEIRIVEDLGHFPPKMLIGGIKQLVEEAVEAMQPTL